MSDRSYLMTLKKSELCDKIDELEELYQIMSLNYFEVSKRNQLYEESRKHIAQALLLVSEVERV